MKYPIYLALVASMTKLCALPLDAAMERTTQIQSNNFVEEKQFTRNWIPYIKLGPELTNIGKENTLMPGGGLGIRLEGEASAVDASISIAGRIEHIEAEFMGAPTIEKEDIGHAFLPKLTYLKYLNSESPNSMFVGVGSAWAIIYNGISNEGFIGLAGVLSAGIEYNRDTRFRQIYQIDVHEPVLGIEPMESWMRPIVEFSFGIGF